MKLFSILISLSIFTSCSQSNTDDGIKSTIDTVFEKSFMAFYYQKNSSDFLKIDISTVIDVTLESSTDYSNGLFLVVNQNLRVKNSSGDYSAASLIDTLFIANHTNRQITIYGYVEYDNENLVIDIPEIIIHDRNFTFFLP